MKNKPFAVVDRSGFGSNRSNATEVASAHATDKLAIAAARKSGTLSDGRCCLMVISGGSFERGDKVYLDTIGRIHPIVW